MRAAAGSRTVEPGARAGRRGSARILYATLYSHRPRPAPSHALERPRICRFHPHIDRNIGESAAVCMFLAPPLPSIASLPEQAVAGEIDDRDGTSLATIASASRRLSDRPWSREGEGVRRM